MHDFPVPIIEHQVISITGRSPMVLLGLEAATPEQMEVSIALDLSDSFGELSKLIGHAKKLLNLLPKDWPVSIFALSSTDTISRQSLRLHNLIETDNWISDLCSSTHLSSLSKRRGSFLRPVLEAIEVMNISTRRLLIVLTDGKFSDFGEFELPAGLEVVCITPNAVRTSREIQKLIPINFSVLKMQDPQLDRIIASYTHPFFGPVVIDPILDISDFDKLYKVIGEGNVISWKSMQKHIINLASGRHFFLYDGSLEDAQSIRWQMRSCSNQSVNIIQSSLPATQRHSDIEEHIFRYFTRAHSDSINDVIYWSKKGDDHFNFLIEEFEQASILATQGKGWINENGSLQVFSKIASAKSATGCFRSQYSAMLAIMVQCSQTGSPIHIGLFSLRRDKRIAIQFRSDAPCHQLLASQDFSIRFDEDIYRWVLFKTGSKDAEIRDFAELEYYASEKIFVPLSHPDGLVTALFSGNLS